MLGQRRANAHTLGGTLLLGGPGGGRALRARTGGRALRARTAPSAPPGPRGQGAVGIIPRLFRMEVLSSGVNRRPAGRGLKALPNDWRFLNGKRTTKADSNPKSKKLRVHLQKMGLEFIIWHIWTALDAK